MKREIKFRFWRDGKMQSAFQLNAYAENNFAGDGEILMQFTGLTDKNGKEAYEGDIVNGRYIVQISSDPNAEPKIIYFEGVIEYAEGCFYVKSKNGSCVFSFTYPDYEMEIFGNIYENPELL